MTAEPSDEAAAPVTPETVDETAGLTDRLRAVRGVVFDLDGTLVLGDRRIHGLAPLPGALELTAAPTARGLPGVTFTSRTTRTPEAYAETLRSIGFDLADDAMLTPATSAVDHFLALTRLSWPRPERRPARR